MALISYLLFAADSFAGRIANSFIETFLLGSHAVGLLENCEALRQLQVVYLFATNRRLHIVFGSSMVMVISSHDERDTKILDARYRAQIETVSTKASGPIPC
jgi:hypothetical protein